VLRDGDKCFYADEDAIAPLWKGLRSPLEACISGWSMLNSQAVVIEDIYADERIPHEAYRPTFVQSLAMVPIRSTDPLGAIGNYWARRHRPTPEEVALLQALADSTAVAMENIATLHELDRRREAEETVRRLSLTDELTGLANRRGFILRVEQARAIRDDAAGVLLFADVDGLKQVNDRLGHGAGDELIRLAGTVLAATFRPHDVVARWGGDEFVAYLPLATDPDDIRRRLLRRVGEANRRRHGPALQLSCGLIVLSQDDARPLEELIHQADQAMYAAKHDRRSAAAALT
jgi:diguanylate cyclase (GGDEF)-like protein